MELIQLIESGHYLDEFNKEHVSYRKYPDKNLMIVKRKYNSKYSKDKPWLNYCRGLVIDYKLHKIVFIPPVKSKEILQYEKYTEQFDTSTLLMDGTMINLFWYNECWNISTRGNIGCTNKWDKHNSFKELFKECSVNLDINSLNNEYTYSFVMRHKKNKIILPILTNELILVEVYHNLEKLEILPENEGYKQINIINQTKDSFIKGYTTFKEGIRYKWISNEYKYVQTIVPTTNNELLNYLIIRKNNNISNYLRYFPEKKFKYKQFQEKLYNLTNIIYEYYKNVFIYKTYEKNDIPFKLRPSVYELHKLYLQGKEAISFNIMKDYMSTIEPKRIRFMFSILK